MHEAVGSEPPPALASTVPVVDRGPLGAQPPINLTIVPAAPSHTGRAKARQRDAVASWPLGIGTVAGQQTSLAASSSPGSSQPSPPIVLVAEVPGGMGSQGGSSANQTSSGQIPATVVLSPNGDSYQVLATHGSVVYIGENGHLIGNTGPTSSSGVVALGVDDSTLQTGASTAEVGQLASLMGSGSTVQAGDPVGGVPSHANSSFAILMPGAGASGSGTAISGFEDHSVSVIGNDQIVTYDDSNVLIDRDGLINANTGDTDSSGLNAVDVVGSYVGSGNSGDGEGDSEDEADETDEADEAGEVEESLEAQLSAGRRPDVDGEVGRRRRKRG